MSDEIVCPWTCSLDAFEDEEGGMFNFSIGLSEEELNATPRDMLIGLMEVAQFVLDHDMLEYNDDEDD